MRVLRAFCGFPALAQEDFSVQHLENMFVSSKEIESARFIKKRYETPKSARFLGSPEKTATIEGSGFYYGDSWLVLGSKDRLAARKALSVLASDM